MPTASFSRVAVIGAGTMGNGIAQVFASHGADVALIDVDASALAGVQSRLRALGHLLPRH